MIPEYHSNVLMWMLCLVCVSSACLITGASTRFVNSNSNFLSACNFTLDVTRLIKCFKCWNVYFDLRQLMQYVPLSPLGNIALEHNMGYVVGRFGLSFNHINNHVDMTETSELVYSAFANSCPLQTDTFLFPLIHSHNVLLSSNKI